MKRRKIEDLQYFVLIMLILGQCTVGENFYLGQCIYLVANIVSVFRSFVLQRPNADKVKDVCCMAITIGLIVFNLLK